MRRMGLTVAVAVLVALASAEFGRSQEGPIQIGASIPLTGGVATSEPFLINKRDLAVRFLSATLKGLKFFNSDREGTAKIMAKYITFEVSKQDLI